MKRSTWMGLTSSFGVMILLYVIGNSFNIEFLEFKVSPNNTKISFIPIIVGLLVAITSNRLINEKEE